MSCLLFILLVFRDKVSLSGDGYRGTLSLDQVGLKLRDPPASAYQVLGFKACATMPSDFLFVCLFVFLNECCIQLSFPHLTRSSL